MTPAERRRAVEVMARDLWENRRIPGLDNPWSRLNSLGKKAFLNDAEIALTALLKIADVKVKEP